MTPLLVLLVALSGWYVAIRMRRARGTLPKGQDDAEMSLLLAAVCAAVLGLVAR
jgi:hypothetical protein